MFPENLPNLSSNREFELGIELLSGSVSISIPHYRINANRIEWAEKKNPTTVPSR